jgi:hypothetical protein
MVCRSRGDRMLISRIIILYLFAGFSFLFAQETRPLTNFNEYTRQLATKERVNIENKSASKAFFLSLILPGLGEAYTGHFGYTKFFLSTETIGWGLVVTNILRADLKVDDYKNFASQHADINLNGKDDQFWIDLGRYNNIYEHNEDRRRQRNIDAIYEENSVNNWSWDTEKDRLQYDEIRVTARKIERNNVIFFGAIVLNHIVSAVNSLRLARAYNRNSNEIGWRFDVDYRSSLGQLSLSFSKKL